MIVTNAEMMGMLAALRPLLERTDMLGYAAARNTRLLKAACSEYLEMQERLIAELGEPETDDEGNPTGGFSIKFGSSAFAEFERAIGTFAPIEHGFEPWRIDPSEAVGRLSGTQLLGLEWMFDFGEETA